ncbi:uncharacterized protein LOC106074349 isoform X2 [Biomphalaria glabrata]|uniref:Uncharacterized protein LOC106074349 isoform X2 n=1 Tax=Biomphalaria glabrata TaxID=6526 RepID=A0A9W2YCW4_BIOGL|nr:uncharacterized protein LOC106074349 isoform X2 [Biomphalaria glabrata]
MRYRHCLLLSLVYSVVHWSHIALSCVLLLQGWTPLSVRERAARGEIAALGTVLRTFKDQRTEDGTYTAEFRLDTVYKGHDLLSKVTRSVAPGNVYNISNFGNKTQCFADVEAGGRYILFLTVYSGQLSAQYEDLFGAASDFDESDEEEVINYLGWNHWTPWSPCNAGCSGGQQIRRRTCSRANISDCIGVEAEVRTCNLFSCEVSHDLLTLMRVRELPIGVTKSSNQSETYTISKQAKLSLPISQIYQKTFPPTFSLLTKVKVGHRRTRSYFFVISDVQGKQQVALFLGKNIKFQYLGNNYVFKMDIAENVWHSIALSVDATTVTLYADCHNVIRKRLRSREEFLGTNLMMSIGPYFSQYGGQFEGEVEQLVLSSDSEVAKSQCGLILLDQNAVNNFYEMKTPFQYTTAKPIVCSPACENGGTCIHGICSCAHNYTGTYCQNRLCEAPCLHEGICTANGKCSCTISYTGSFCQYPVCNPPCQNGGSCVQPDVCSCPTEWTGQTCAEKKITCPKGCYNGGKCVAPNVCSCPVGFYGKRCQKVLCEPRCQNGGVCVSPELCICPQGYHGSRCQKVKCNVHCMNGGTCLPPNQCQCPPLFYGKLCQREVCRLICFNGGRCNNNRCTCPPGFEGKHCERRSCIFEQIQIPQRRTYRKVIQEEYTVPCDLRPYHTCRRTRLKYVLITKETYRTIYTCS